MAFDQTTRNRLARFVSDTRSLLAEEFTRQLQNDYGLDPNSGDVTDLARLEHLDDARRETARLLRDTMEHYLASADTATPAKAKKARQDVLDRIVREQAFTILNRLCALRMAEARGLLIESIAKGYQSKGFQLYQRLAGTALGETGACYRQFIFSVFDEFAVDLPVLFDRFSPQGRLFPREAALLSVLQEINHPDIDPLWAEDETIGWIYQYFNSVEERRQMRAASQAPRNSRELAVRNQFFTPRYVVEFLTDNTLGRIWYEMTKGESSLKDSCRYLVRRSNEIFLSEGEVVPEQEDTGEELSQEELLKQPVHILHRPLKDPRDIKMLDPACGSMHFGLYAFDLFERIYEEAWEIEAQRGADGFVRTEGLDPLHESYSDKEGFLRDVPRLIIERNIHGIDIDPRAVQIAGLSLWLRAQRSWQAQNVKALDRAQIQRSNIVCAEPMPGEADMLEEFTEQLQPKVLGQLVRIIFEKMKLAGEAGSLLKIEEEIKDAVSTAHKAYRNHLLDQQKDSGYLPGMAPKRQATLFDFADVPRIDDFWNQAEQYVLVALEDYAKHVEGNKASRHRMFAHDAAQGFSFVKLCRTRFDVAIMNPPFGGIPEKCKNHLSVLYGPGKPDAYRYFFFRMLDMLVPTGTLGAISSRTFHSLEFFAPMRREMLVGTRPMLLLADLGGGVLDDAAVETSAYVVSGVKPENKNTFQVFRLEDAGDKACALQDAIADANNDRSYIRSREDVATLPGGVLAYWLPSPWMRLFKCNPQLDAENALTPFLSGEHDTQLSDSGRHVCQGLIPGDTGRFTRLLWETPIDGDESVWAPMVKGGEYSPFDAAEPWRILWEKHGREIKAFAEQRYGGASRTIKSEDWFFQKGLSFPNVSSVGLNVRLLSQPSIFTNTGYGIIPENIQNVAALCAFLNSRLVFVLCEALHPGRKFDVGPVASLPVIPTCADDEALVSAANKIIGLKTRIYANSGRGWARLVKSNSAIDDANKTRSELRDIFLSIAELMLKINQRVFKLAGFSLDDESFALKVARQARGTTRPSIDIHPYQFPEDIFADLLDDILPSNEELKADWGLETLELILQHAGIATGEASGKGSLCEHAVFLFKSLACLDGFEFQNGFIEWANTQAFDRHLKQCSNSPRIAPICWPLSTPSGSYTIWLYYHCLTDQTLYTCVNDFVDPKLKQVSDDAASLRGKSNRSSSEEKELERLNMVELELKDFRDELLQIARFWKPNLNDGVQITAAPLWNLFQHRQWKARLKDTWEKLEAGAYDWAHLALSVWPDRVVRASHKDRSYAIAHDLDDQLWHEVEVEKVGRGGRVTTTTEWQPRDLSSADLQRIITEVKAR